MPDAAACQIVSLDFDTPERAILTVTINGVRCQLGLGFNQVEIIEAMAPQVRRAMSAAREEYAREKEKSECPADAQ